MKCKRCSHEHKTRYALCWSKRKGLFTCRCQNHPLPPEAKAVSKLTPAARAIRTLDKALKVIKNLEERIVLLEWEKLRATNRAERYLKEIRDTK